MATSRPFSKRPLDALFLFYFLIHIPITLLVDVQPLVSLFHQNLYPPIIKQALTSYIELSGDFLMSQTPPSTWFLSILTCELLLQFPFFFYGAYCLWVDTPTLRIPGAVYAAHVLTTMVPILASFTFSGNLQTSQQRMVAFGVYGPWLVIPLLFLWRMTFGFEAWRRGAFDDAVKSKVKKN